MSELPNDDQPKVDMQVLRQRAEANEPVDYLSTFLDTVKDVEYDAYVSGQIEAGDQVLLPGMYFVGPLQTKMLKQAGKLMASQFEAEIASSPDDETFCKNLTWFNQVLNTTYNQENNIWPYRPYEGSYRPHFSTSLLKTAITYLQTGNGENPDRIEEACVEALKTSKLRPRLSLNPQAALRAIGGVEDAEAIAIIEGWHSDNVTTAHSSELKPRPEAVFALDVYRRNFTTFYGSILAPLLQTRFDQIGTQLLETAPDDQAFIHGVQEIVTSQIALAVDQKSTNELWGDYQSRTALARQWRDTLRPGLISLGMRYSTTAHCQDATRIGETIADFYAQSLSDSDETWSAMALVSRLRVGEETVTGGSQNVAHLQKLAVRRSVALSDGLEKASPLTLFKDAAIRRFDPDYKPGQGSNEVLAYAYIDIKEANTPSFDVLEEILSATESRKSEKLTTAGIHLLMGDIRYTAERGTTHSDSLSKLHGLLTKKQPVSPNLLIKLANTLTPKIALPEGSEALRQLDETRLIETSVAVDRLVQYVAVDRDEWTEAETSLFDVTSRCAQLLISRGVKHKSDQSVITLGDLVVRYPGATPYELQQISDRLQKTRDEGAAHRTYRALKARRRSAGFKTAEAGRGLLS